jgi:hypothetical protein
MKAWADGACNCCRGPAEEASACIGKLPKPDFPETMFDAMMTNPNHEVGGRYEDQVRTCCTRK